MRHLLCVPSRLSRRQRAQRSRGDEEITATLRTDVLQDAVVVSLTDGRLLGNISSVHRFSRVDEVGDPSLER
jgi:hypothetical protein